MPALAALGYALLLLGAVAPLAARRHPRALAVAALAHLGSFALLLGALLGDRFELRYIAAYSAAELPPWLKAASVWGGEQGTLLLLATLCTAIAWRYRHSHPACRDTLARLAAAFGAACLWWSPFAPGDTVPANGAGLNAHLLTVWMAVHPPLVFFAYALVWAPLGPALACLRGAPTRQWREMVEGPARLGWLLLSAGLASGMWWAFQDFTFGQVWHWDPVQTATLVLWLLLGAQMHGLRQCPPEARPPRHLLWASVLAALAVPLALWVVRDDTLASSHRYVGATSWPLMAALAAAIAVAAWRAHAAGTPAPAPKRARGQLLLLRWAAALLLGCALVTTAALLYSYACAAWQCSREFAPFKAALLSWVGGTEAARVEAAFAQWEVDQFRLLPALLPLLAAALLLTGHSFARPSLRRPWRATLGFAVAAALVAHTWQPLRLHFVGDGVTTGHTVAAFAWLEVLLLWCLWPALGALLWCARAWRRQGFGALRHAVPVAVIHLGAVLALVGGTVAGSLDSAQQRQLELPRDYGERFAVGPELQFTLAAPQWRSAADGGAEHAHSYRALSTLSLAFDSQRWPAGQQVADTTVYRDSRRSPHGEAGSSFRQRCLVLDHRFARHLDRPGLMIDPVIHRALISDVQVWLPAPPPRHDAAPQERLLIVREFPLLSLLWAGWVLMLAGATALVLAPRPRHALSPTRRPPAQRTPSP